MLERTLELAEVPDEPCFLVLDVVQVVGEDSDADWSQHVREGRAANLRRHQRQANRLLEPLCQKRAMTHPNGLRSRSPRALLQPGKNTIRLELTGMATKEKELDDFGVLQMAVEFRSAPNRVPQPPHEPVPLEVDDT